MESELFLIWKISALITGITGKDSSVLGTSVVLSVHPHPEMGS